MPEVFSERYTGVDGAVPLPVSSHECGRGTAVGTLAMRPCAGQSPADPPDPAMRRESGVLCYANRADDGYVFDIAPRQPGFGFVPDGAPDLLWRGPADFDWLP